MDSAKELVDKLATLKALLDKGGYNQDPQLKEQLNNLEKQLTSLGIQDGLGGVSDVDVKEELNAFLGGCVAMSMRRIGTKSSATQNSLRLMANGRMTPDEAAKSELWKLVAVCVTRITDVEFTQFKAGKMASLPKKYVDIASKPEAEDIVDEVEDHIWTELRTIAKTLSDEMSAGQPQGPVTAWYGYVAGVPVLCAVALLAKKFMDMRAEEESRKNKAKKKQR